MSSAIAVDAQGRQLGQVMLQAATYQLAAAGARQTVVRARPDVPRSVPTPIAVGYRPGRSGFELRRPMDDAVIEDRVMLGAGSLVPPGKVLESGNLYIGRPAVRQRALTEDEIAYLKYSAEHYVRVKNNYLNALPASAPAG